MGTVHDIRVDIFCPVIENVIHRFAYSLSFIITAVYVLFEMGTWFILEKCSDIGFYSCRACLFLLSPLPPKLLPPLKTPRQRDTLFICISERT